MIISVRRERVSMNRRGFLRRIAATGSIGVFGTVAGCTGGGGGGDGGTATPTQRDGGTPPTGGDPTGTSTGGGTMTGTATTPGEGSMRFSATVNVFSDEKYGDILVGPDGLSLYLLTADKKGKSMCYNQCANIWPPLTVTGTPSKSDAVTASLGTLTRKGGSMQVTVGGRPLYYFNSDTKPGQTKGQGIESFGGVWYLIAPDGSPIKGAGQASTQTTGTTATTTTDGGGGDGGGGYGGGY
jgi:predicted lipoprotein with Yx(FWY)xxD motif